MRKRAEAGPTFTWAQVRAYRSAQLGLTRCAPPQQLLDVVRQTCGIQAQVQSSADLQLGIQVAGIRPETIRKALWQDRTLVRTWCMRGTLHLLTADDLPYYVAALRTHDRWWKGAWLRMVGCSAEELQTILAAVHDALGAEPLTREQLAAAVADRIAQQQRARMLSGWAELLKPAAFAGSLIAGPPQGQYVTFVRPDRWLGSWHEPSLDEAWRYVTRQYLRAYGPASREEFARWWGMQPAPAGRVLDLLLDELVAVSVEGHAALALRESLAALETSVEPGATVRLLPAFDVYTIGQRPRAAFIQGEWEPRVFRAAGWISPVIVVDGEVVGVWSHTLEGGTLRITLDPFVLLGAELQPAITAECGQLGAFFDATPDIAYGSTKDPVAAA